MRRIPLVMALLPLLAGLVMAFGIPAAYGTENRPGEATKTGTPIKSVTPKPEDRPSDNERCRFASDRPSECRKLEVRGMKPDIGVANSRLAVEIFGKGFDPDLKAVLVELDPAKMPPLGPRAVERVAFSAQSSNDPPKNLPAPNAPTYPIEIQRVSPEQAIGVVPPVPAGRYGLLVASGGERDYTAPAFLAIGDGPYIGSVRPDVASNERPIELKIEGYNFQQGLTVTLQLTYAPPFTATPPLSPTKPVTGPLEAQSGDRPNLPSLPRPLAPVTGPTIVLTDGLKVEPREIKAIVPPGLAVGVYLLTVTNPDGKSDSALPGLVIVGPRSGHDLVAGEIWTDPKTVRVDDDVRLGLRVKRLGGDGVLTGVKVTFYLGRPEEGKPIGTATLPPLRPHEGESASVVWNTAGLSGTVAISAMVDPDDVVRELTELNNVSGRLVRILPPSDGDETAPKVTSVEIDGGVSTSTDRAVFLSVQASDEGSGLNSMLIVEKVFFSGPREWSSIKVGEWMTYSSGISYTLSPDAGVHYLAVFVSDKAGNISRPGVDWVNYLPVSDAVRAGQVKLFREDLRAGDTISISLTTLSGDADLYLFGPGGRLGFSINATTTADSIVFTAQTTGRYVIEVEGFVASTYSLNWTVGKGGASALAASPAAVPEGKSVRDVSVGYDVPLPDPNLDAIEADPRPTSTSIGLFIPAAPVNQAR